MQTSQVSNLANMLSAPAAKQPESAPPAESFDRVLSREVSERKDVPEADTAEHQTATNVAKKQQTEAKPAPSKAASPGNAGKASKSGEASDADTETTSSDTQVSDEMLALVASLNQILTPAASTAATKTEGVTDAALGTGTKSTLRLADGLAERKAGGDNTRVSATDKEDDKTSVDAADQGRHKPVEAMASREIASKAQEAPESAKASGPDFAAKISESLANVAATMPQLQPSALQAAQAAQPAAVQAAERLMPQVGSPGWDQALGQKVVWMVAGEQQSASLSLNPPDLGPLQVVLSVSNSHASATFTAAQPEVRQALEAAMPKLRDMLGEAGIQLGQATVNSGSANQQGTPDRQASRSSRGAEPVGGVGAAGETAVRVGRVQPAASGAGLVDTFV